VPGSDENTFPYTFFLSKSQCWVSRAIPLSTLHSACQHPAVVLIFSSVGVLKIPSCPLQYFLVRDIILAMHKILTCLEECHVSCNRYVCCTCYVIKSLPKQLLFPCTLKGHEFIYCNFQP
jgi:hypothetical protein